MPVGNQILAFSELERRRFPGDRPGEAINRGIQFSDFLGQRRLTPDALGGNEAALNELITINPQAGAAVEGILSNRAAGRAATTAAGAEKRANDLKLTSRALDAIANADPNIQPQVYAAALERLRQAGVDLTGVPEQYDPNFVAEQRAALKAFSDQGGFDLVTNPDVLSQFREGSVVQQGPDGKLSVVQAPTGETQRNPQTDVGKQIFDKQLVIDTFGEGSPQALAFDEAGGDELPKFTDEAGLRKEFTNLSKDFVQARAGLEKVRAAAALNTGAGDIATIFGFMKTIDPASTVREGEFATAEQTGGVPQRITALYNRLVSGERLTPEQRASFQEAAESQFETTLRSQKERENTFRAIAERRGFDPNNVALDFKGDVEGVSPDAGQPRASGGLSDMSAADLLQSIETATPERLDAIEAEIERRERGGSQQGPLPQGNEGEFSAARQNAERRFPFLKRFKDVKVSRAVAKNKGGMGEFEEPDSPNNPNPGSFTITIGENSANLQGGAADTIIADMVHAAGRFSPEFKALKKKLRASLSPAEVALARRRYENDFKGKFSGSTFATFENFMNDFWLEGTVQHLLLPENSEIGSFRQHNPKALPVLNEIEQLFKGE